MRENLIWKFKNMVDNIVHVLSRLFCIWSTAYNSQITSQIQLQTQPHADTCSKSNMHLHVCISSLTHMYAHTHMHQHKLTLCDMRNQTQRSHCSTLHALFIMFSFIELLMSYVFCFSTLFLQFCEKFSPFTNDPLRPSRLVANRGHTSIS